MKLKLRRIVIVRKVAEEEEEKEEKVEETRGGIYLCEYRSMQF